MRVERKGIPISSGIALGKVVLLDRSKMIVERVQVGEHLISAEKERFLQAVKRSKEQLLSIRDKLEPLEAGDHLQILNLNIMMLEDELLADEVLRFIESERVNAEWAVNHILSIKSEAFRKVEDQYMKERLADIYYMGQRILRNLHGVVEDIPDWLYRQLQEWLYHVLQFTDGPLTVPRPGHGLSADTQQIMLRVRTDYQPWLLAADDPALLDAIDAAIRRIDWDQVWPLQRSAHGDPDTLEQDPDVLRHIVHALDAHVALDCRALDEGEIQVGDPVALALERCA